MFKRKFSLVGELRNSSVGNNKFGGRGHPMNNTLSLRVSGVSQVVLVVKNLPAKAGDTRDAVRSLSQENPLKYESGNPLQYSCLKNSMAKRSIGTYSLRGRKELDTTELLSTHTPHHLPDEMKPEDHPTSSPPALFHTV